MNQMELKPTVNKCKYKWPTTNAIQILSCFADETRKRKDGRREIHTQKSAKALFYPVTYRERIQGNVIGMIVNYCFTVTVYALCCYVIYM
jgi:hypothetical protein